MKIETIGVAGLGLLGRGIAACCLAHGFRVMAYTQPDQPHAKARDYIQKALQELIDRAGFPTDLRTTWTERFQPAPSLADLAPCDFVIESVVEDLEAKQGTFAEIEQVVRPDVPIASNTSSIPISQLQENRAHPERFVGMHWAEPAHATRFLEVIRGRQTSDSAFQAAAELGQRLGKEPSLAHQDVPGFIVNRIGYAMYREAAHMLAEGMADVETIDRSCRNAFGLWAALCGPFRWMDITGGPALYARCMERVLPTLNNNAQHLPEPLERLKREEAGGSATGRGFYSYEEGDQEKWEALFHEFAWRAREMMDRHFPREEDPQAMSQSEENT